MGSALAVENPRSSTHRLGNSMTFPSARGRQGTINAIQLYDRQCGADSLGGDVCTRWRASRHSPGPSATEASFRTSRLDTGLSTRNSSPAACGRHRVNDMFVQPTETPDVARVRTMHTVIRPTSRWGEIPFVDTYGETVVRLTEGWRFRHRNVGPWGGL
jgi:hypothetical protein